MNEQDLINLKAQIATAETEAAKLDGQRQALMDTLREQWKVSSIKAAETKLEKMEEEIERKEGALQTAIEEVEERYND